MNTAETIDAFRQGVLDLDCKRIVLRQCKDAGEVYEGPGYVRQTPEGALTFKIYVTSRQNVKPLDYFNARLQGIAGQLHGPDLFYDLTANAHDGTVWNATHVLPHFNWDMRDMTVIGVGQMQSLLAELEGSSESSHYLRLYFFAEHEVPLHLFSSATEHGNEFNIRDRAEFKACDCAFEVRKREGSGETIFEVTSDLPFPPAFESRIQEALQFLTGKSAFWRAKVERRGNGLAVELLSPWRTAKGTQLDPPISRASIDFMKRGWNLFAQFLAYVVAHTEGKHWNPVAYHLYNACESSAGSVDAWAVGISVAVEAVASLIHLPRDEVQASRVALLQQRMLELVDAQNDLADVSERMRGLIRSMGNKRPLDTLYALVETGHIDRAYAKAWDELRNRHVHPKPKDLRTPQGVDYQELLDRIHRAEVVLRQLTFYLIGYEGPYTDYGAPNSPSKSYPAAPPEAPSLHTP